MLKKLSLQLFRENNFVIILFVLSLLVRTYRLDRFPLGIIHDELNYVLNAKSLFLTGSNIPLTASAILSWGEKNFDVVISELPSLIIMPWIGLTKLSLFTSRFPYAVVSSLSVIFLYLITKNLVGKNQALFAGLIMAFNPWSIHIGRTALEVNFATLFYLVGVYFALFLPVNKILLAFPFFLAMFLSYLGAKLHFVPIIFTTVFYRYFGTTRNLKNTKKYLILLGLSLITLILYTLTLRYQPAGTRKNELIFFEKSWAASSVNDERRQSIPNIGMTIFSNKASVILKRITDVYLKGFSTTNLFSKGETVAVYSVWEYGQFHFLDFFLIMIGLVVLFNLRRKEFWFIAVILLLAPFVSSIDLVEHTFAIRAYPMFPFLCMLSGVGFWYIKERINLGKIVFVILVFGYATSVMYFLNLYFYRYPIYAAERWFFGERILATYVNKTSNIDRVEKITVSTIENPKNVYEKYLFYNGFYNEKEDVLDANNKLSKHDFSWKKVNFIHGCPSDYAESENEVFISQASLNCQNDSGKKRIVDLKDAGTVFVIDNDPLCDNYDIPRYYRPMDLETFSIESQGNEQFCKNWIVEF